MVVVVVVVAVAVAAAAAVAAVAVVISVETQFQSTSGGSPFQCGASSSSSNLCGDSVSVYQCRLTVSVWSQ